MTEPKTLKEIINETSKITPSIEKLLAQVLYHKKLSNVYTWLAIGTFFLGLQFLLLTNEKAYAVTWWGWALIFVTTSIICGMFTWRANMNLFEMRDYYKRIPETEINVNNILSVKEKTKKLKVMKNTTFIAAFAAISFMLAFFGLPEDKQLTVPFYTTLSIGAVCSIYSYLKIIIVNKKYKV